MMDVRTDRSAQMNVTWTVPGALDTEKLKLALSRTLQQWPSYAGRLSYDSASKKSLILLNNEGVPLKIGSTNHPGIFSKESKHERHPGSSSLWSLALL